jgi:hypothetical protein
LIDLASSTRLSFKKGGRFDEIDVNRLNVFNEILKSFNDLVVYLFMDYVIEIIFFLLYYKRRRRNIY